MRRASGQAIIEAVLTLTLMLAACVGLIHAVLMAWWAIAMPLVHSELEREVLAKVGLVQLVIDPPGLGQMHSLGAFNVSEQVQVRAMRWLLPAAPSSWRHQALARGDYQMRCMPLKDDDGSVDIGCRTDWKTPLGWHLSRSSWLYQRVGGAVYDERAV
jgi:hypothetical protein